MQSQGWSQGFRTRLSLLRKRQHCCLLHPSCCPPHTLHKLGLSLLSVMPEKLSLDLPHPSCFSLLPTPWEALVWELEMHQRVSAQAHPPPSLADPLLCTGGAWAGASKGPQVESRKKSKRLWGERILHIAAYFFPFYVTFLCVAYSLWKSFQWFTLLQCLVLMPPMQIKSRC